MTSPQLSDVPPRRHTAGNYTAVLDNLQAQRDQGLNPLQRVSVTTTIVLDPEAGRGPAWSDAVRLLEHSRIVSTALGITVVILDDVSSDIDAVPQVVLNVNGTVDELMRYFTLLEYLREHAYTYAS